MEEASFIIILGQSLSNSAFWIGFILVMIFAHNRFQVSDTNPEKDDPHVISRSFTTRFRYYLSAAVYIAVFEFLFVVLVGIGSFPVLQDLLAKWVGSLQINGDVVVGTPAWAALLITSVIPAAPGFSTVDRSIRLTLHDFASIPKKARGLANEILDQLTQEGYPRIKTVGEQGLDENGQHKPDQLSWIYEAIRTLQDARLNPGKTARYQQYFANTYKHILEDASERRQKLEASQSSTVPLIISERDALTNTAARFLSCALLHIEPSERDARDKVRDILGLSGLPVLPFDFKLKQIILSVLLVMLLAFAGGITALGLALPQGWGGITREMVELILYWLPYTAIMMVTPFILAAGLLLYFMDKRLYENKRTIPLEDKLLAVIGLSVGCFGVGILPSLVGIMLADYQLESNWVMQVAPFGLTPACVGVLFYLLASWQPFKSELLSGLVDVAIFSSVTAGVSYFALKVAFLADLDASAMTGIAAFSEGVMMAVTPVTYAIMVGVTGAIQCNISRPMLQRAEKSKPAPHAQGNAQPQEPAADGQGLEATT